jgi:hypothetical protein
MKPASEMIDEEMEAHIRERRAAWTTAAAVDDRFGAAP